MLILFSDLNLFLLKSEANSDKRQNSFHNFPTRGLKILVLSLHYSSDFPVFIFFPVRGHQLKAQRLLSRANHNRRDAKFRVSTFLGVSLGFKPQARRLLFSCRRRFANETLRVRKASRREGGFINSAVRYTTKSAPYLT